MVACPQDCFARPVQLAGREHLIDREATIGSAPDNAVVLPLRSISRRHARIAFDQAAAAWVVEDLHSSNGTRLDNRPVIGGEKLGGLHVITFAEYHDFVFQVVEAPGARSRGPETQAGDRHITRAPFQPDFDLPPSLAMARTSDPRATQAGSTPAEPERSGRPRQPAAADKKVPGVSETVAGLLVGAPIPEALLAAAPSVLAMPSVLHVSPWCLELQDPAAAERTRFRLFEGQHTIGRSLDCDVRIDNRTMSRRHATVTVSGGRVTVIDLSSANGTFMHNVRITREVDVPPGTPLRFGEVVMTLFHDPLRGASERQ